jgi:hypothetical protein
VEAISKKSFAPICGGLGDFKSHFILSFKMRFAWLFYMEGHKRGAFMSGLEQLGWTFHNGSFPDMALDYRPYLLYFPITTLRLTAPIIQYGRQYAKRLWGASLFKIGCCVPVIICSLFWK